MGENSAIEWTDHTFNAWVGCTKVSPACDHCYAEGWAKRTGHPELWQGSRRRTTSSNWQEPIKWNKRAAAEGRRAKVFCSSLADVFDNQVPEEWRWDLWELIAKTSSLDWLLLTKRPQNIAKMLPVFDSAKPGYKPWNRRWPWPNVWLGTTVENQDEADRRVPHLLATPAAKRFLSCEPLLGPVFAPHYGVDWIIVGGESGPGARPMHPDWARSLRDQCQAAGVSYFFKQWGEWLPGENYLLERPAKPAQWQDGETGQHSTCKDRPEERTPQWRHFTTPGQPGAFALRVGKKRAGAMLDGREWRQFPK